MNLYDDYAYVIHDHVEIGTIQRIILNGEHGKKDYVLPVPYNFEKKEKLSVVFTSYTSDAVNTDEDGRFNSNICPCKKNQPLLK